MLPWCSTSLDTSQLPKLLSLFITLTIPLFLCLGHFPTSHMLQKSPHFKLHCTPRRGTRPPFLLQPPNTCLNLLSPKKLPQSPLIVVSKALAPVSGLFPKYHYWEFPFLLASEAISSLFVQKPHSCNTIFLDKSVLMCCVPYTHVSDG